MNIKSILRSLVILIILVVIFYLILNSISKLTGYVVSDNGNFECLKESKKLKQHGKKEGWPWS